MMSWLSIVLFIIMHIPDLITLIKAIIAALHGQGFQALEAARVKLSDAIQTGDLNVVRKAITDQGECLGVACPANLKGTP